MDHVLHINRVGPIKTTDPIPAEIVPELRIEDVEKQSSPFLFVVAKNLAVPNYSATTLPVSGSTI